MYEQKAKAKQPSHETRKHGCRRSYLEWCQEVGTWPRIAMSRVLDTRNRTDSSKNSFAASRLNRDRRINFASTISDDVKLISRIFRVFRRLRVARPGGDGKRRDRMRDYFSNGKCHFPVYTTSVPGFFLSTDFAGNTTEIFRLRARKNFW